MSNSVGDKGTQTWGEYTMRIPENEYHILVALLPDLQSKDAETHRKAWKQFAESPLADAYRMTRSPSQVRRGHNNRIIVK